MIRFTKWPSIDSFHHIRKATKKYPHIYSDNSRVAFSPKVKLHGSNGAVLATNDGIGAQSRGRLLNENKDNLGFYQWIMEREDYWRSVFEQNGRVNRIIYGEYCGPGVQKGVAISKIPNKIFAVFAIQELLEDKYDSHGSLIEQEPEFIIDPAKIKEMLGSGANENNIFVLPWYESEPITIDWALPADQLLEITDKINEKVKQVEKCDPFVKEFFDIEGLGEGLVYYPISHPGRYFFSNLGFKAKGEKHQVVVHQKPAQIDPEVAENIEKFVEMVITEARLEQGAREVMDGELDFDTKEVMDGELDFDTKKIGSFIKWMCVDVKKECMDELEKSGLDWKPTGSAVSRKARDWYLKKYKES